MQFEITIDGLSIDFTIEDLEIPPTLRFQLLGQIYHCVIDTLKGRGILSLYRKYYSVYKPTVNAPDSIAEIPDDIKLEIKLRICKHTAQRITEIIRQEGGSSIEWAYRTREDIDNIASDYNLTILKIACHCIVHCNITGKALPTDLLHFDPLP